MLDHNSKLSGDFVLSIGVFFPIIVLMVQYFLMGLGLIDFEAFRVYSKVISAIPMLIAVYYMIRRNIMLLVSSYVIVFFVFLISILIDYENYNFVKEEGYYLLLLNIPSFVGIASIRDLHVLKGVLRFLSYVISIMGLMYMMFIVFGIISFDTYSMTFSYFLLLPAIVFVGGKNLFEMMLFLIILGIMLLLGSRGSVIAASAYAVALPIFYKGHRKYALLVVLLFGLLSTSLLSALDFVQQEGDFASRTITLFQDNDFFKSSGRDVLYSETWQGILSSPILGKGVYSDRVLLGMYVHNFFLEVLYDFGLIFGPLLLALLLYKSILVYSKLNEEMQQLQVALFFYGFFPLLVSASYLNHQGFGIFLGTLFWVKQVYSGVN